MRPYLDTEDSFYSWLRTEKTETETPKKDDSIISKKVLVIFAVVAIIKISILLFWI
jgi:hypothetical protein